MKILFFMGPMQARSQTAHSLYLARKLVDLGHELRVISGPGPFADQYRMWNLPCEVLPFSSIPGLDRLGAMGKARKLLEDRPDLIHVQSLAEASRGASFAQAAGIPYFLTCHGLTSRHPSLRVNLRLLRGIVAGSQEMREQLVNRARVPRNLIKVISAGVDTGYFRPARPETRPEGDRIPVVSMVGRFEQHKGGDLFIDAAALVLEQRRQCHFLIAGEGPENENWRKRVQERGITKHVTFAVPVKDYRLLYHAIDIFVRPALREGSGLSVLEAMASGKPVVATGIGGVYSVVEENETGFVVSKADAPHLAAGIMRLIDNPALAMKMGEQGRAAVEQRFDIADKARELVAFYEEGLDAENF